MMKKSYVTEIVYVGRNKWRKMRQRPGARITINIPDTGRDRYIETFPCGMERSCRPGPFRGRRVKEKPGPGSPYFLNFTAFTMIQPSIGLLAVTS